MCPDCGESPANYEVDGAAFCGLHEITMLPCRVAGQFLLTTFTDDFRDAWKFFPNANVPGA